jgi:hypothetical protein
MAHHLSSIDATPQNPCSLNVWINHSDAMTAEVIAGLREADRVAMPHDRILNQLVITSQDRFNPAFAYASHSEVEGDFDSAEAYVEWAVVFAAKHQINTVMPGRFAKELYAAREAFQAIGVTVLQACGDPELAVTEDRPALYRRLAADGLGDRLPAFVTWKDDYSVKLTETIETLKLQLGWDGRFDESFCVIPAQGNISERLFHFVDKVKPWHALEQPEQRVVTVGDFGSMAHSHALELKTFKEWVVMERMRDLSITVDCLAWDGVLLSHVIRAKEAGRKSAHLISKNVMIRETVERLAKVFTMRGVFSVKFLVTTEGNYCVLAMTAGITRGIAMSTLAGVTLPWLWLKLHESQGAYDKIPHQEVGLSLGSLLRAV